MTATAHSIAMQEMREHLGAPPRDARVWDEQLTYPDKRLLLKAARLPQNRNFDRWDAFSTTEQEKIRATVRRWAAWLATFAGCF